MSVFNQEKPEELAPLRVLTVELINQQMEQFENELKRLMKINKDPDRATNESLALAFNIDESRKMLLGLHEKLALIDFWRSQIK